MTLFPLTVQELELGSVISGVSSVQGGGPCDAKSTVAKSNGVRNRMSEVQTGGDPTEPAQGGPVLPVRG